MTEREDPRERSVSGGFDDSDLESHADDGSAPPGKPGRKKNPNSQAARRDQNRIAQREFRLRKQQRIRDLEARVEILSGGKDEALGEMRSILKDLMQENHTLRSLLRSLAAFIGDGAGGLLPKLGWEMADFNNFVNRSETDTAWESYQRRKKQSVPGIAAGSSSSAGQKRAAEEESSGTAKKARSASDQNGDSDRGPNGYPLMVPMDASITSSNGFAAATRQAANGLFSDLIRNDSPIFIPSPASSSGAQFPGPLSSHPAGYQNSFMSGLSMTMDSPLSFPVSSTVSQQRNTTSTGQPAEDVEEDDDPNKHEVYKLVHYHLDNYKRNTAYCLPSSLRPTLVQRTVPHESVIDEILHPELRDRMILLRNKFDLVDCLHDYRFAVVIHGDDVLAHSNWEIGEKWLRKYGLLVDPATLAIANKWRRERGDAELTLADVAPADGTP